METWSRRARRWIIAGYLISSVGIIASSINIMTYGGFWLEPVRDTIQEFLFPLSTVAILVAWWFLSQIFASGTHERSLARKAFTALAIESLLVAGTYLVVLVPGTVSLSSVRQAVISLFPWVVALGALVETVGFILMFVAYAGDDQLLSFDASMNEVGDDVALEVVTDASQG
jgi:hypothetical protein